MKSMKKFKKIGILFNTLLIAFILALFASPCLASAASNAKALADYMADELNAKFTPQNISVTIAESTAYVEASGVLLDGVRVDTMRIEALLKSDVLPASGDTDALASLIGFSKGELTLLEKDVNAFFGNADTKGFSGLNFDFTPQGFKAKGLFTAKFLFTIKIRLAAEGVLALQKDGIYLENVGIFVEGLRQPEMLTEQVTSRVNPLLEFKDIPFPVSFGVLEMDDEKVFLSGKPTKPAGGVTVTRSK